MNLGNLFRLSTFKARSISPENPTSEPVKAVWQQLETSSARNAARDLARMEGQSIWR